MKPISFCENWRYAHRGGEDWRPVTLPHDAMLAERCSEDSPGEKNTGWYVGADYVYEKRFFADTSWRDKDVVLAFEGVYRNARVYLNDQFAGGHKYGYGQFYIEAGALLRCGEENVIRVEAFNADQPNSRWYTGAGIYRPVWLYALPKQHILLNGIRIRTTDYRIPRICVGVQTNAAGNVRIEIFDGKEVVLTTTAPANTETEIVLAGGKLWSPSSPNLYTCRVTFGEDVCEEIFGIREIQCDAEHGFCINGERVILRGACIHHDNGILGAVNHPFADARKVELLQKAGYNAIRSAHNPCSVATLEACDRLGMLVLDEYSDMWYIHKTKYDYASDLGQEWRGDLKSMAEKDYNHPSVIMYSIGNEVAETGQKRGIRLAAEMTQYLHLLDDRPVTCGINIFFNLLHALGFGVYTDRKAKREAAPRKGKSHKTKSTGSEFFNDLAGLLGADTMKIGATMPGCNARSKRTFAVLDVAGYNYGILRYKRDLKHYKDRVIVGSETFCSDARKFWCIAKRYPALIGDFVWAGMDYLGEVGIGAWEYADYAPDFTGGVGWKSASAGRLDLTGRPWAETAYMQVAFDLVPVRMGVVRPDKAFEKHSPSAWRMSNALESWSWDGCEGKKTVAEVYATGYKVRLILNGKTVGEKKVPANACVRFKVAYEPGELTAISLAKDGKELGRTSLVSAGKETKLTLVPERSEIVRGDLCYIRLQYTDEAGEIKPLARGTVKVEAEGGEILGLGSACPYNEAGYLGTQTDTYYGEALAIVRPTAEQVTVRAESPYGTAQSVIVCREGE